MPKIYSDEEKLAHKTQLFEVGLKSFNEKGFKNINIDKLVNSVGVSKGYFYLLFNSKEEFFLDALLWKLEKSYNMIYELKKSGTPVEELIKIYLNAVINAPYSKLPDYGYAHRKINRELLVKFLASVGDHHVRMLKLFEREPSPENAHILANLISGIHFSRIMSSDESLGFPDGSDKAIELVMNTVYDFIISLPPYEEDQ